MSSAAPDASPLRTVRLAGELGRIFGREHHFAVANPAEAVRALCANFPAFRRHMIDSGERGVGYRVLAGQRNVSVTDLDHPTGREDIRIVPVISGAGGGGPLEIIAGIVLIGAAIALGPIGMGADAAILSGAEAAQIGVIGLALALGGISNLLSPQRQTKHHPSLDISGNTNVAPQGVPVPIGYGEMFCGSIVISAGVTVDQVPTNETGLHGLSAIVQTTTDATGARTNELYASWQPAGNAVGYIVVIEGPTVGVRTLPQTNSTSIYNTVGAQGPFTVTVTPVESNGSYGSGATVQSVYVGGA